LESFRRCSVSAGSFVAGFFVSELFCKRGMYPCPAPPLPRSSGGFFHFAFAYFRLLATFRAPYLVCRPFPSLSRAAEDMVFRRAPNGRRCAVELLVTISVLVAIRRHHTVSSASCDAGSCPMS
jgi:hypothetical protein